MRVVTCPGCGRSGKIPDSYTGARAKCPKCATTMDVPAAALVAPEMDLDVELEADVPDYPGFDVVRSDPPRLSTRSRPLPWFYEYLTVAAYSFMLIDAAVGGLATYYSYKAGSAYAEMFPTSGPVAPYLVTIYLAVATALSFVSPAIILLALDMGRTLREIRERPPS